jgi:hypothetical protein
MENKITILALSKTNKKEQIILCYKVNKFCHNWTKNSTHQMGYEKEIKTPFFYKRSTRNSIQLMTKKQNITWWCFIVTYDKRVFLQSDVMIVNKDHNHRVSVGWKLKQRKMGNG